MPEFLGQQIVAHIIIITVIIIININDNISFRIIGMAKLI